MNMVGNRQILEREYSLQNKRSLMTRFNTFGEQEGRM